MQKRELYEFFTHRCTCNKSICILKRMQKKYNSHTLSRGAVEKCNTSAVKGHKYPALSLMLVPGLHLWSQSAPHTLVYPQHLSKYQSERGISVCGQTQQTLRLLSWVAYTSCVRPKSRPLRPNREKRISSSATAAAAAGSTHKHSAIIYLRPEPVAGRF